jgi:DNA-binding IclR family transcriptional regulator
MAGPALRARRRAVVDPNEAARAVGSWGRDGAGDAPRCGDGRLAPDVRASRLPDVARSQSGESVLLRVVRILEAFSSDTPTLTVTAIARRAGLPLATASRLVGALTAQGLLTREPGGRVRVGVRLWELAQRASPTLALREVAMPFMEDLHSVVGHHVQLGVLDGDEVLFVERLAAPQSVINYTRVAGRLPVHASSSGLVLLAHASREQQERVLAAPLRTYTAHTLDTPRRLRAALADIRRQRFAFCPGHIHPDACGIAAPVRDPGDEVIAALSVIVPNDDRAREPIPALLAAARGITRTLAAPRWTHAAAHPLNGNRGVEQAR